MSAKFWVDIFEDIVTEVRNDTDKPVVIPTDSPYYLHGHPLDIIKTLNEIDRSPSQKAKYLPLTLGRLKAILVLIPFEN